LPGSPGKSGDDCERENGGGHTRGLLSDSTPSLRRDQEQQSSQDGRGQTCRHEEGKPTDYHLPLAVPIPALDRPERQLGCDEERRRHHRCTRVDRAWPQAEKDGVSRTDPDEATRQKRGRATHQTKRRNYEA
jgi:hypothetical protein